MTETVDFERKKLIKAGSLHWFHWFVVILSFLLTLTAWWFSASQIQGKLESAFLRESNQIVELLNE